jgi:hypothetical protein
MTRRRSTMTLMDVQATIARKYTQLQDSQLRCDLPPLTDLTHGERLMEVQARLNRLATIGPSVDLWAALGAHAFAGMRAASDREEVDVSSGDAA